MNVFSLSWMLWLIVIISVSATAVIYFLKNYNKSFLWAHQVMDPLQHGLLKWNRQLNNWWQHLHFFQQTDNLYNHKTYQQSRTITEGSFAEELIDTIFSDTVPVKEDTEVERLKEENQLLQKQQLQLTKELHLSQIHNKQLLHEINELLQFRKLNMELQQNVNKLQAQLNNITGKWTKASHSMSRLNDELNSLTNVEKDWIDAVNRTKDLERRIEQIPVFEAEIKSLEAEREWLHIQLQQLKTKQLHEFKTLQENCNRLVEERNLLQHKMVLLESEAGALSRALNNNKQQQNEDVLWENKYITAARELNNIRIQYAAMEQEVSILRSKEQLLREKAKMTDGLQTTLQVRTEEIISLQRQLYDCRKK
ncbi:MAG: hypothetical protein HYX40_06960 [Sphingobacteriales bacterium]|nr:hypothetical protein [Sphingobacteriales bacterium]